ncbi:MAG: SDR family NAD(P)-dependent oxidoreductase [Desulfobacterales bacterium]|nr:SDR family NAD(P)-dependent oxidoreductase [Desulfobacterales bacterium]
MKPIEEQIILVTGSTDGIGKITARKLAEKGATVLILGRSRQKCEDTAGEIRQGAGNDKVQNYVGDLSSLAEVRNLAEKVSSNHPQLQVLINNAGVGAVKGEDGQPSRSRDGYPLCFAVNCLHPGSLLDTKMVRENFGSPMGKAESGADVEVYVATDPALEGTTGANSTLFPSGGNQIAAAISNAVPV